MNYKDFDHEQISNYLSARQHAMRHRLSENDLPVLWQNIQS